MKRRQTTTEQKLEQANESIKRLERANADIPKLEQALAYRDQTIAQQKQVIDAAPPKERTPAPAHRRCQAFLPPTDTTEAWQCPFARTTGDFCGHGPNHERLTA